MDSRCPICNKKIAHKTPLQFEIHVNNCLDNPSNPVAPTHNSSTSVINDATTSLSESTITSISPVPYVVEKRKLPWFKRIVGTTFTVDAFCYGKIDNCTAYFLSHFHSDHYQGLSKSFNYGPIYCSQITANLLTALLGIDSNSIVPLPLNEPIDIEGITVILIDANHCPGAVLFHFSIPSNTSDTPTRILHTGDFRVHRSHMHHPLWKCDILDFIYLDTTYCNKKYSFPSQDIVLDVIAEIAKEISEGKCVTDLWPKQKQAKKKKLSFTDNGERQLMAAWINRPQSPVFSSKPASKNSTLDMFNFTFTPSQTPTKTLYLVGSYTIGKEKVFRTIAKVTNSKVYADAQKRRVLRCLMDTELDQMFVTKPEDADIHVVSMGKLNKDAVWEKLSGLRRRYKQVVVIKPTGWTFDTIRENVNESEDRISVSTLKPTFLEFDSNKPPYKSFYYPKVAVIGIPYSEHSSYRELRDFLVNGVHEVGKVVPTVSVGNWEVFEKDFKTWEEERKKVVVKREGDGMCGILKKRKGFITA
ncbi:hypothetical protein HK098_007357 [Nowakowskiella sp. JEL0407]|nr:hypothetical protein HK098_007357 [Nowakowskiella sp. JEL0407]